MCSAFAKPFANPFAAFCDWGKTRLHDPSCQLARIRRIWLTWGLFQQSFARYRSWHSQTGIDRETYQKWSTRNGASGGNKLLWKLSTSTVHKTEDDTPPDSIQPSAMSWDWKPKVNNAVVAQGAFISHCRHQQRPAKHCIQRSASRSSMIDAWRIRSCAWKLSFHQSFLSSTNAAELQLQAMARWCQIPTLKPPSCQHFRTAHSILLHPWGASARGGSGIQYTYTVPIQTSLFSKSSPLRDQCCFSVAILRS